MSGYPKPWAPYTPVARPAPAPLRPVADVRALPYAVQRPLTPRHGMTTGEGWLFDPWMFRWIEANRLMMRRYRVRP